MLILQTINEHFKKCNLTLLPETALFLVGANPLPLYVAAKALEPQKILLLGTPETADIMTTLKDLLKSDWNESTCDESDSIDIEKKTASLLEDEQDVWLFYTGGTKAMVIHSFNVWQKRFSSHPHWATYLSPMGPRLWFNKIPRPFSLAPQPSDNPYSVPELSLDNVLQLHQMAPLPPKNTHHDSKYIAISNNIHSYVFNRSITSYLCLLPPCHTEGNPKIVYDDEELYGRDINFLVDKNFADDGYHCRFDFSQWIKSTGSDVEGRTLDDIVTYLANELPTKNADRRKARKNILQWIAAMWLECWVARCLKESGLFHQVFDSVKFEVPGVPSDQWPEVDVCCMRGHTPFVFSCTIDTKLGLGKHKLFEVRLRANQLGGDHARAAVVCLSQNPDSIQRQLNQGWKGYGTIKVFGKGDIFDSETFQEAVKSWVDELEV